MLNFLATFVSALARLSLWRGEKLSVPAPPVEDAAVRRPVKFMLMTSEAYLTGVRLRQKTKTQRPPRALW